MLQRGCGAKLGWSGRAHRAAAATTAPRGRPGSWPAGCSAGNMREERVAQAERRKIQHSSALQRGPRWIMHTATTRTSICASSAALSRFLIWLLSAMQAVSASTCGCTNVALHGSWDTLHRRFTTECCACAPAAQHQQLPAAACLSLSVAPLLMHSVDQPAAESTLGASAPSAAARSAECRRPVAGQSGDK